MSAVAAGVGSQMHMPDRASRTFSEESTQPMTPLRGPAPIAGLRPDEAAERLNGRRQLAVAQDLVEERRFARDDGATRGAAAGSP